MSIARGATVLFTTRFYDNLDRSIQVSSANIHLSYRADRVVTTEEIALVANTANTYTATWDSSVADGGQVFWHVRSADEPVGAGEDFFVLTANPANP